MKTNVFKGFIVALGLLLNQACSSEEKSSEKNDSQNQPKIELNKFNIGAFSLSTKYDSLVVIDTTVFNVPEGIYRDYKCQLFETSDGPKQSIGLYIFESKNNMNMELTQLVYGHFYTRYPETAPLEFEQTSDTSYHITLEKSHHFDFRMGKDYYMVLSLDTLENLDGEEISILYN